MIGIALLAGCSIFAIVISNFSKPNSAQSQTSSSLQPNTSSQLMNGDRWVVWSKEDWRTTYVDENSIKKTSLFSPIYEIRIASEYPKANVFIGTDANGKEYPIRLQILKVEYDCKSQTEKIISVKSYTTPLSSDKPFQLTFDDLIIGKARHLGDEPDKGDVGFDISEIGRKGFRRLCSQ